MMASNLLAHPASFRVLSERSPAFLSKGSGRVPAPPLAASSKPPRLRSEVCAAAPPDSRGCASCPPSGDFAQSRLSPAIVADWAWISLHNSISAVSDTPGLASVLRGSHASGLNIHSVSPTANHQAASQSQPAHCLDADTEPLQLRLRSAGDSDSRS